MTMTSDPEGDFTEPEEMTELEKRIKEFRHRRYWNDSQPYGSRKTFEKDLRAEILWLKENKPFEYFYKGIDKNQFNDALKERDAVIWGAAFDALLLYLEDKK